MMRTAVIFITIAGLLALGLYVWTSGEQSLLAAPGKPWVEVAAAKVFMVEADGSTLKELRTGDEVESGTTLRSDVSGKATIHLPDGSALRLDSNSTLVLELARLETDETFTLKATLVAGRVWSKVVGLATPRSSWEVKTSNAVATVRGTAFLTEYRDGATKIFSAEHVVEVQALDPVSMAPAEGKGKLVTENAFVEIDEATARAIASKQATAEAAFVLKAPPKELLNERFVKESRTEDKKLDDTLKVIKEEVKTDVRTRKELREEVRARKEKAETLRKERNSESEIIEKLEAESVEAVRERVRERLVEEGFPLVPREEEKEEVEEAKEAETPPVILNESGTKTGTSDGPVAPAKPASTPTALVIETKAIARAFTNGEKVSFRAVLVFEDGTRLDVTDKAAWKVSGNIGTFASPGIFLAKLRDEDSEIGEIKGGIETSFSHEGILFTAKQIELIVAPFIEETELRG